MKREIAVAIVELMEEQGFEASLREDYVGRGFGTKPTTGIIVANTMEVMQCIISDALEDFSILKESELSPLDVGRLNQDSMGLQTILY